MLTDDAKRRIATLRMLRRAHSIAQAEVTKKIGRHPYWLCNIERGYNGCSEAQLEQLERVLQELIAERVQV
jgi:transcriptional regulator with XRE-family HTH domain